MIEFVQKNRCRFWAAVSFLCAFAVFCFIHYSDGDDAIFDEAAHSMDFAAYLKTRYLTWTGRMGGEALIYCVFRFGGIWFWRVANAAMLTLLPFGILSLVYKPLQNKIEAPFRSLIVAFFGFLLMDIMTFGHACVWVNGSILYLWCAVACTFALRPVADAVFETDAFSKKQFYYAIPLTLLVVMSIEQLAMVLLGFLAVGVFTLYRRKKSVSKFLLAQLAVALVAFVVSAVAPGNGLRTASELQRWVPAGYALLSVPEHLFITLQWLVSSFANELRLFFVAIWLLGILLPGIAPKLKIAAGVFAVAALLPYLHVNLFADMGLGYIDPAFPIDHLPSFALMTGCNVFAMVWWIAATVFTAFYLRLLTNSLLPLFAFAGAILSECMMYFSPTIYASGERVYFVSCLLLLFVVLGLIQKLKSEKIKTAFVAAVVVFSAMNALSQVPIILSKI